MFFFEKRTKKLSFARRIPQAPAETPANKVFLLLFVHKKKALLA